MSETTLPRDKWPMYRCAPAIAWLRDADQTLLVDAERGQFWSIRGVEAAIWDLLTLNYPYEKIVPFLSLLMRVRTDEAEGMFLAVLRGWQEAGVVQIRGEGRSDQPGDQRRM
jgi:hypothetical protein